MYFVIIIITIIHSKGIFVYVANTITFVKRRNINKKKTKNEVRNKEKVLSGACV